MGTCVVALLLAALPAAAADPSARPGTSPGPREATDKLVAVALKRLRNIAENPVVALVVDRYDEDWKRLGWVMLRGKAEILSGGTEHRRAQALLRSRYPQLRAMRISRYPVIAVRIERVTSWGDLSIHPTTRRSRRRQE